MYIHDFEHGRHFSHFNSKSPQSLRVMVRPYVFYFILHLNKIDFQLVIEIEIKYIEIKKTLKMMAKVEILFACIYNVKKLKFCLHALLTPKNKIVVRICSKFV